MDEPRPRTAPWASPDARARLDAVEASLPAGLDEILRAAADAAREHARRIDEDALLLYAGGNVPPAASPASDGIAALLSGQPSMGYPGRQVPGRARAGSTWSRSRSRRRSPR